MFELPGWEQKGEFLFSRTMRFAGLAMHPWPEEVAPEAGDPERMLFFDTETTGLSGGAGSVIFLMGTAWREGEDLVLEQLFLLDFPGEPDFLEAVKERFSRHEVFVSYNGKTFDSRLLAARFIMNRIPFRMGRQIDLLHLARRLWRPITGDCTLKTVESRILGVTREADVAGEDIPMIYLSFLRTGVPGPLLPAVFSHNVTDVTSLARMWEIMGGLFGGRLDAGPVDERALGSYLLARNGASGLAVLSEAFKSGRRDAGIPLSLAYKRRGEWEKAVEVWSAMLSGGKSLFAAMELAKYLEHRRRDPRGALETVEAALLWDMPVSGRQREEIRRRRARLERKVGKLDQ
jgi:uncharacterized protein YprB with RNaseH-like and TPR domain